MFRLGKFAFATQIAYFNTQIKTQTNWKPALAEIMISCLLAYFNCND